MDKLDLALLVREHSLPHDSAHLHVTGSSIYVDDRPPALQELLVGVVISPHAKARIISIIVDDALLIDDVVGVFTAADLHHNHWGSIFCDQPLLAHGEVNYAGEVVALVAASTTSALQKAISLVKVDYDLEPAILSIEQALLAKNFIGHPREIKRGDAAHALSVSTRKLSGTITINGADHFYLENQAAIAYPQEDGQIRVVSSTQHPTETQALVAEALGLTQNNVVCEALRLGGGFGGKETQAAPFAAYVALVAHRTGRPARLVISKDDDMRITGKRNPYQASYTVGFDDAGSITALTCTLVGDGGAYADLSPAILERAMAHVDNAYYLPHVHISGMVCRTNYQPHTAFRGFGGPKGVALIEHVMEEIAFSLGIDALDVRMRNVYRDHQNTTPYGQTVENNLLPGLFHTLAERANYRERRREIARYNSNPNHHPRGLSLTAIKFGICFTARFFNQAHALVHILRDGSVQIATGAVEMGQGVQARIKKIVASSFGIAEHTVRIMPTATDKNSNTSPTAASSGTDLNGAAALDACEQLKNRLSKLAAKLTLLPPEQWPQKTAPLGTSPDIDIDDNDDSPCTDAQFIDGKIYFATSSSRLDFVDVVNAAYFNRVQLSAYGFYKVSGINFNKLTGQGHPFLYFTQGVACSEVEVDRLSGQVKVLRTDILMDAGIPINDALDRGQIAGGFVQGLGWITSENLCYSSDGTLLSHSPSTYKIPSVHDMPRIFSIDLVKNEDNHINVNGTKAMGEPPLMLCFSIWNAIKNALSYDLKKFPNLPIPATPEIILRTLTRKNGV